MALMPIQQPLAFAFGLLGNIVSFMVYLAPLPTFYRVYKKKSTEGFQSVPYVVALFSAMIWIFYAFLKTNAHLLITINTVGCVIETIYIGMFIAYAPNKARILTAKLLLLLNLGVFCAILVLTLLLAKGSDRVRILGWVCVTLSVSVFAAPLSIMRLVIRTKSVEYMPFSLSFFLTLSAVIWFTYGMVTKDYYVALPNVLGFVFGVLQMVLYMVYKDNKKVNKQEEKLPEHTNMDLVKSAGTITAIVTSEVHQAEAPHNGGGIGGDEKNMSANEVVREQTNHKEKSTGSQNEVQLSVCEV